MLKRCQILLDGWQVDFIKRISKRSDHSISEAVRLFLSLGFLYAAPQIFPQVKGKLDSKKIDAINKEGGNINTPVSRKHALLSQVYFEARKLAELISAEMEKEEKKLRGAQR